MIITARQLEDLHKHAGANGHVTLPYRARLTPLAVDFVRSRKIALGYADVPSQSGTVPSQASPHADSNTPATSLADIGPASSAPPPSLVSLTRPLLWWCDGPCGPAKAALVAEEKQSSLRALDHQPSALQTVAVIKAIAADVKSNRAGGAILIVQSAAAAVVLANRCPSLRAIVATTLDSVESGTRDFAANVLVVEHPNKTLAQIRNLVSRFIRGQRAPSAELQQMIGGLTCA